jgi:hypothetical protein
MGDEYLLPTFCNLKSRLIVFFTKTAIAANLNFIFRTVHQTPMLRKLLVVLFAFVAVSPARSTGPSEVVRADSVWEAIKVFEGDFSSVTGDFDCQGMSIGVAQWNIGKSFSSVKEIVLSVGAKQLVELMPTFGARFADVLNGGKDQALAFVRSLHSYANQDSCNAKQRIATWNTEGKVFAKELSRALSTSASIATQRRLRSSIFNDGMNNAKAWAISTRGDTAKPSLKEIAYFVDMQIFNGGGLAKFGIPYRALAEEEQSECLTQTIEYLKTASDDFLFHKLAARKNAEKLKPDQLNGSEKDLFCYSYRVAKQLNADQSRQFRLTTINRRAAILYGEAFYSDRDKAPTRISLTSGQ